MYENLSCLILNSLNFYIFSLYTHILHQSQKSQRLLTWFPSWTWKLDRQSLQLWRMVQARY